MFAHMATDFYLISISHDPEFTLRRGSRIYARPPCGSPTDFLAQKSKFVLVQNFLARAPKRKLFTDPEDERTTYYLYLSIPG